MAKKEIKYEEAVAQLEEIVDKMENDELDIDQLSDQLKRAKELVKLCKDKLTKTDELSISNSQDTSKFRPMMTASFRKILWVKQR